jgi:copper chaperone CopZ
MTAPLRTEVIGVRGMQCGGCERTVSLALAALPGVTEARADFVAEEVEVTFEPDRVGTAAMRSAVRDAGFTPE